MISLGQSNTIVSCPGLTTHSELDERAQQEAGITPSTIRIAVGDEDVKDLIAHFVAAARLCVDPEIPGFSSCFMPAEEADRMVREVYLDVHTRFVDSKPPLTDPAMPRPGRGADAGDGAPCQPRRRAV
jgi:hypothetical protein